MTPVCWPAGKWTSDFVTVLTTAPVLTTARLTLRGHTLDDFDDCATMWADPLVTKHIGGKPFTREDVWARVLRYIGHWNALGYGYWCIRETATGRFLGEGGFADFHRDIEPSFGHTPESGWALAAFAHGQGYASEFLAAITEWSDAHFADRRTVCMISPENAASIRVAQKCGYRQFASTDYKNLPSLLFERLASGATSSL
jgi:RimJ/RimL family protein N-acetyltransferase